MPVNLKTTEFAPAGVQAGSSSRTFHPEATGAGGKVQSKKTIPVERQTLTFTWLPKNKQYLFFKVGTKKSGACYGSLVGTSLVSASHNTTSL